MATGKIGSLYPPGNNGSSHGAGKIIPDGGGKGIVFQTPQDVNQASVPLVVGQSITYDLTGGQIGNISTPAPAVACTLQANPTQIKAGESATLSWTSQSAVDLSIDNGIGSVTPLLSGSITITPKLTAIYTITATDSSGATASASAQIAVSVNI